MSEVDGEEIGREESVDYTGNANVILAFQSSDWTKFPPISYTLDIRLPLTSAPNWTRCSQLEDAVIVFCRIPCNRRLPSLHPYSIPSHYLNHLTPNDPYMGRTAPLNSKRCILYIYSTNVGTEYFKHALYSTSFYLQNAVCFITLTSLVPVLFTFYVYRVCWK